MLVQTAAQDSSRLNNVIKKSSYDSLFTTEQLILKAKETGKRDTSAADTLFRLAINNAIKANDFYGAGNVYYELGEMYFLHKNHNRSLGAFINAKNYFVKAGSEKEVAFTNFKLGRTQYYRGNYKLASGHLSYAMRLAKKLKLKNLEADVLEYLGILYHVMPNPRYQSSKLLIRSLVIKQQLKDENGALRILEKLAGIYYDQKKFDSALYYSNAAVRLAEKLALHYDANLSRLNAIPALLRLNQPAEAARRLQFFKTHVLDSADVNVNIRYYIQAGNYYTALQDTAAAQENYNTALKIALHTAFPELSSLVYRHMADAWYYNGDFKKAYECQLQFSNNMSSLYSKENFNTFKELEYIFKTNVTEDEVKFLNMQNEMSAIRLKDEQALRLVLMLSAAGFLLSAVVILVLYRRQKAKGRIIEKQAADLKILMKEIHHRVKNNLQVISSLLDLQSLTIGDSRAAEAIKESRNRVQTMALIHQNLYQDGNMKNIEMEAYINNLAANLFSAYNVRTSKITLHTKTDAVSLPVDLVVLIGFVLNELISNALKHAFCNKEKGILNITLQQHVDELLLEIKDNGDGFPPGFAIHRTDTFGFKLVNAFAKKLKARLDVFNNNGACVQLHIRNVRSN